MNEEDNEDIGANPDFMEAIYTTTTCFRHSYVVERALMKAAEDKHVTKTHIIQCCLLGTQNLNRYIDGFDMDDLNWIHERQVEAFMNRKKRRAAIGAVKAHEKIDSRLCDTLTRKA